MGFMDRFVSIARPLVRISNLPGESGVAFTTSFASAIAGNTIIANFYREGRLNEKELILSALLNGVPVYIREIFTYQIPIILPALGLKVGLFYISVFFLSGIFRLLFVVIYGKVSLKPRRESFYKNDKKTLGFTKALRIAFKRQSSFFLKISVIFIGVTFLVFFALNAGFIGILADCVKPVVKLFNLPGEIVAPLTAYIVSPIAGIMSMGILVKRKIISEMQAILALLLGGIFMLPILSLRNYLPKYSSIFGLRPSLLILGISNLIGIFVRLLLLSVILAIS